MGIAREPFRLRVFAPVPELFLRRLPSIVLVFGLSQLPRLVAFLVDPERPPGLGYHDHWYAMIVDLLVSTSPNALAVLASMALEALGVAVILLSVLSDLEGERVSLAHSARRGLARFGPVLLTGVFVTAMFVFGTVSYVVPGLFALGYFWLAVPSCVAERVSPFRALGRSGELSAGAVPHMMALALVTFVLPFGLEVLVASALRTSPGAAFALIVAVRVVFGGLAAVGVAVSYRELRRIKDDVDGRALVRAFE
ncbi:MAG: hypothetical protein IT385_09545 [Deltaproteobacteria bacterium]|nr:hypothetical protein [Deltaproteobacteria bacterium]